MAIIRSIKRLWLELSTSKRDKEIEFWHGVYDATHGLEPEDRASPWYLKGFREFEQYL